MKKNIGVIAAAFLAAAALSACGGSKPAETTAAETKAEAAETTAAESGAEAESSEAEAKTDDLKELTVGASPAPHAEILEAAREELAKKGYDLKIVEYTDYVQPNLALDAGDLDANYFQHLPYLESFNKENGTNLVSAGAIHYEPFGVYAGKTTSLDELQDGATIAVPNDTTNEARALLLLEAQGLIKLKEDAGLTATKNDIVENPKNLQLYEVEAAQLLVYKAAMAKATQKSYGVEAAMAKLYAAEVAMEVTTKAVQLHGGYGYIREYDVERMMRDAKITEIYEGTSEIQKMVIAGNLLK